MLFPFALRIDNYRSIRENLEIPFSKKITFLVGQNNSGKSNILRLLSIFFNKAYDRIDEDNDFDGDKKTIKISTWLSPAFITEAIAKYPNASARYAASGYAPLKIDLDISRNGISYPESNATNLESAIGHYFGYCDAFLRDFSQSGGNNHGMFLQQLSFEKILPGTAYLPNIRFITEIDKEPPSLLAGKLRAKQLPSDQSFVASAKWIDRTLGNDL